MNPQGTSQPRTILSAAIALALLAGAASGDVYDDIVAYDWTQSRAPLAAIEGAIREAATPAARQAIETKLLKALANPKATRGCKQFVCRMLRRTGSAACVPALARLLPDPELSHMARFALQHQAGPEATAALCDSLATLTGTLRIGVITSLGARRDAKAVPALAKLMANRDAATAQAATAALGRLACPAAAETLAARAPARPNRQWADAYLLCADGLLADGQDAAAAGIYRKLFATGNPKMVRIAALRGIVLAEKDKAAGILLTLMKSKDVDLRRAASKFVIEMPGEAATRAFADRVASLSTDQQIQLLDALTARADPAAAPAVTKLLGSADEGVRVAAIRALGVVGDASSVPPLARAAAAGGAVGGAAVASLNRLRGEGVGDAMGKLLDSPDRALRAGIVGVLATRADRTMAPVMLKAARDEDSAVRQAAIRGLASAAGEKELPGIVALLLASTSDGERAGLQRALAFGALRVDDAEARAAPIVAGLARASAEAKVCLVSVLGRLGGTDALTAVRAQLAATNADVLTEAVRALAAWPDAAPAADLLGLIKTTTSPVHKVLAFRGYLRIANMPDVRPAAATAKMYQQALALATSVAEKKSVLSGLANARSVDALELVEPLMANAALRAEAELAYVQIADNARHAAPEEARAALKKTIAATKNDGLRKKAQAIINEMDKYRGYITAWLGSGPYTKGSPYNTAYPPEKDDAKDVQWKALTKGVGPQVIDLDQAIANGDNRAAYMKTHVWSAEEQDVRLEIGSDDGVKVWVNGKRIHANNANRGCKPAQDKVKAKLNKGWNLLLVKIADNSGQWAFCVRICRPDGAALDGLRVSLEGE